MPDERTDEVVRREIVVTGVDQPGFWKIEVIANSPLFNQPFRFIRSDDQLLAWHSC